MQIRTKLTLQFIIVVSLIILFGFGIIYYTSSIYSKQEFSSRLENKAQTSAEIFVSVKQIDSTTQRILDRTQKDKLPFESIHIYNSRDRLIYTNNDVSKIPVTKKLLDEIRDEGHKNFMHGDFEVIGITYQDRYNHFIVFAEAIDQFGLNKLRNLRNTLLVLFLVIISIVALAGWIYAGKALQPLSEVVNEVKRMRVDKLDTRLAEHRNRDEIGNLVITFNTLLDRLENAFKLQRIFVSGASHELKNPLTAITSQLQVSLLNERTVEEYKQSIASVLEDVKQLNRTAHDLMEFARLNYENQVQLSDVRLDDLLWFCRDYFHKTQPDFKVNIRLDNMPEDENRLIVRANEALLKIAFTNLIDNACKFSKDKTCEVQLLSEKDGEMIVKFSDKGIGLSPEESALVFEPFYKADSTSETRGNGIGLALTKKIVQLHDARIELSSQKGIGTTVLLLFRPHLA